MSPKTIVLSLGGTVIAGGVGIGIAFLSGAFNSPQSSIRRIVWRNRPTTKPNFDSLNWRDSWPNSTKLGEKKIVFNRDVGSLDSGHPWAKELSGIFNRDNNIETRIAEWCWDNSDGDVDVESVKGDMLKELCDVTFE